MLKNKTNYGQKEEDAVNFLIRHYRRSLLNSSIKRMGENGLIWRENASDDDVSRLKNYNLAGMMYKSVLSAIGSFSKDVFKIAEDNFTRVVGLAMYSLTPSERDFYIYFISLSFYCTHATSVRNVETRNPSLISRNTAKLKLESWKTLKNKGIGLGNRFLPQREAAAGILGNDDFVFFSIECGSGINKSYSRFGNKLYRFKIDRKIEFNYSFITLNNLLVTKNQPKLTLSKLITSEQAKRKIVRNYNLKDIMAVGDVKKFICCSLILFLRQLSTEDKECLLNIRNEQDVNILINSVFRPQICIPHRLYAREDDYEVIDLKNINSMGK